MPIGVSPKPERSRMISATMNRTSTNNIARVGNTAITIRAVSEGRLPPQLPRNVKPARVVVTVTTAPETYARRLGNSKEASGAPPFRRGAWWGFWRRDGLKGVSRT